MEGGYDIAEIGVNTVNVLQGVRGRVLNVVEATIADLRHALESGEITSLGLVTAYLDRIEKFDRNGPCLNAVPVMNPDALAEAQASDARRQRGETRGPLDGIPYTAKNSYKVKGMTVAAGSPAFANLIATDDAFAIAQLRKAGAILLGLTNMPPMANGGMQRGPDVDGANIFPSPDGSLPDRYTGFEDDIADYPAHARAHPRDSFLDIPTLEGGLRGLEETRRIDLEDWMDTLGLDAVIFPAVADVGPADADTNPASADLAWRNGTWVANGNLAIRHLRHSDRDRSDGHNDRHPYACTIFSICRKAHLFGDVDRAAFSAADALCPLVQFGEWSVGLAICYDVEFPELVRAYALAGADAILVPTANMLPYIGVATRVVPARAEENEIYVAYANRVGAEGAFEYCGLSCVTGPDGVDLARAGKREEMIFADLSKDHLSQVRKSLSHIKDRRTDLYP
ncbi:Hydrolase in pqqF 5'region [Nymphon striatum]|nr:Hydrolase in pqqF 5'region [Nymphon striatum]